MTDKEFEWELGEGKLPLDFSNTAEWHARSEPTEHLNNYADLVRWSQAAQLVGDEEAEAMLVEADRDPLKAAAALERSLDLRETLFRVFANIVRGEQPDETDLAHLNQVLAEAQRGARLLRTPEGYDWDWEHSALDWMLYPIARSAADLLTSDDLDRVGFCADDQGCGWLFFDTSRNHSRRWCSMESCGNRAKARRHYQKQSQPQAQ